VFFSFPIGTKKISVASLGTAVYAYRILDNNAAYTALTQLTFSLDGVQVGKFEHTPDGSGSFVYNTLVYANPSISNGQHTFAIDVSTSSDSLILFDYVVYSYVLIFI
jgi:hypothetical protein